ncbi:MAG: hypothetical protein Tsb0017_11580 [Geothermobacteraceae bacterium]
MEKARSRPYRVGQAGSKDEAHTTIFAATEPHGRNGHQEEILDRGKENPLVKLTDENVGGRGDNE